MFATVFLSSWKKMLISIKLLADLLQTMAPANTQDSATLACLLGGT